MATSPPGDIVMDVMRAADPDAAQAARARLQAFAAAGSGDAGQFATMEASLRPAGPRPAFAGSMADNRNNDTYVRFEAMILQSFIESMLPQDSESVFGSGMAGDMWKSMMAEQLAMTMARRGGIGIAERVLGDHYINDGEKVAIRGVDNDPARNALEARRLRSESLVHEIQRKMMDDIAPDNAGSFKTTSQT